MNLASVGSDNRKKVYYFKVMSLKAMRWRSQV